MSNLQYEAKKKKKVFEEENMFSSFYSFPETKWSASITYRDIHFISPYNTIPSKLSLNLLNRRQCRFCLFQSTLSCKTNIVVYNTGWRDSDTAKYEQDRWWISMRLFYWVHVRICSTYLMKWFVLWIMIPYRTYQMLTTSSIQFIRMTEHKNHPKGN